MKAQAQSQSGLYNRNRYTFILVATFLMTSTSSSTIGQHRGGSCCQALLQNLPNLPFRGGGGTGTGTRTGISTNSKSKIVPATTSTSTSSSLKGGYDATIGPNPSNPIQFFTLDNGMCPYAARTLIVLNELQLDHEVIGINMSSGIKPDWYLKINPREKVPALRVPYHNNEVVYESAICDEYLCDLYDATCTRTNANASTSTSTEKNDSSSALSLSLMPSDPMEKAKIRMLNDQCDSVLNPTFFTYLMNKDGEKDEEMKQKLEEVLRFYENILSSSGGEGGPGGPGGPYMNGKEFTLADVHILPFFLRLIVSLRHFKNYHITEDNFPNLIAWFELCSQRASVQSVSKSDEEIIGIYEKFVNSDYSFGGLNKNKNKN